VDGHFGTGLFWTAPLMLAGLCLGGWSAWKWMNGK
jgi:ATP synthase protein I